MPLKLGELFSKGSNKLTNGSGSILLSPIWTALICVVVVLATIWFVMHKEVEPVYNDTSFWTLLVKTGIWSFISLTIILYVHSGAIERNVELQYKDKNKDQIIQRVAEDVLRPNSLL